MRLNYYWREALAGIQRAKLMSLLSVSSITAALFLSGSFLLVTINFQRAIDDMRQRLEILVFLEDAVEPTRAILIGSSIRSMPGVRDAAYVSRDEALRQFRIELADKADLLEALETNPLPQSFKVTLLPDYRTPEAMAQLADEIKGIAGVEEVEYGRSWMGRFYRMGNFLIVIDLSLLAIVGLASMMVVFNTIMLTLYARRQAIDIMRLVGATNGFIRRPFLLEGMLQGLAGSLLGGLLLYVAYRLLSAQFGMIDFFTGRQFLALAALGVALGGAGSWIAVQRFLGQMERH